MLQDAIYMLKWYLHLWSLLGRVGTGQWRWIVTKFMERIHGSVHNIT